MDDANAGVNRTGRPHDATNGCLGTIAAEAKGGDAGKPTTTTVMHPAFFQTVRLFVLSATSELELRVCIEPKLPPAVHLPLSLRTMY